MKNKTKPVSRQKKQIKDVPEKVRSAKKVNKRKPVTAQFWQSSLDAASDAVCFLNIDQRILHCNRAMEEMFGLTKKDIIGKRCWEIVHGSTKPIAKCPTTLAKKTLARSHGEIRKGNKWFNIIADPMVDKKGRVKGIVHTLQDITEQKRILHTLKESENKYRELMENISEVIFSVDIQGSITYISPAMEHITGYSTNEIIGTSITDHIIPEDLPNVRASIKRILISGQEEAIEYRVKIKNGGIRYVVSSSNIILKNGQPAGLTGIITDISRRKQAEEALRETESKFRTIFDYASDGILLADANSKNFISANKSMCAMLGYTKEEILKLNVSDIHPEKELPYVINQFEKLAGKEIAIAHDIPVMKKDKTVFFADVNSSSIILDGKECLIGMFRDTTERKQAEEALKERDIVLKKLSINVPGIIYQFMMKPGETFCVPFSTAAVKDIYGCSPEDIVNDFSPIAKAIYHEDVDRFIDSIKQSARNMSQWQCEYRVQVPGKPLRWIFGNSTPEKLPDGSIIWHGFCTDITEKKQADEKLKQSQENYKRLFEDHSAIELIIDPETGAILDANHAAVKYYGWTRKEIKQMKIWQINTLPPEEIKQNINKALRQQRIHFEFCHCRADGSIRNVDVYSSKIKINDKDVLHSIVHDITERKKAEESLLLINKAVEGSSDAIGISDPHGHHFYQNKAFSDLSGYSTPEELQAAGGGPATFANKAIASEVFDAIMSGRSWQGEVEMISKSGRIFPVLIRADAIKDEAGKIIGLIGIHTDITERKQTMETLRASEEKYRGIFDESISAIYIFDKKKNFIDANQAGLDLLGYSREELMKMSIPDVDVDPVGVLPAHQELFEGGRLINYEHRLRRKDGSIITVLNNSRPITDGKGNTIGMLSTLIDITERKQAEAEIAVLSNALKLALDPILILDLEGKVINVNEAAKKLFETEDLGISALDYVAPEDKERVTSTTQALLMGSSVNVAEFTAISKSGRRVFIEATGNLIVDENGKTTGLVVVERDISERKRMEEALRESETKLKAVIQGSPVPQFVIDKHHQIIHWNKALQDMSGIKSADILGTSKHWQAFYATERPCLADLLVDEKTDRIPEMYKGKYNESKYSEGVYEGSDFFPAMGKEGRWLFFSAAPIKDTHGNIIGAVETLQDMTERKKAEENLKQSMLLNEAIINSVPGLLYLYDDTGHLIHWNKQHEDLTGYSGEEIKGSYILDWFGGIEPDTSIIKNGIAETMAKGSGTAEAHLITKDGNSIFMFFTGVKINISGRDHLLGIGTDITDRKKTEEELKKYREHLEELVRERTIKLEASNKELEAFSYSASHDLRAPLRSIEGFSQALLEDYEDKFDTQGKDYLTRIKMATRRMADLIEDMLQLSRITRIEMIIEKVDLTTIARSVITDLQKSQPQRNVKVKIAEGLEDKADLRLTRIIMDNLLRNAWKFTEKEGKAIIEFGLWKEENGKKVYFIRDNGAGFDMAYADKLFAPFQRLHADDEFPGTGIGLATVRRIINRHGGRIWAEGETGIGATFYFSFSEK